MNSFSRNAGGFESISIHGNGLILCPTGGKAVVGEKKPAAVGNSSRKAKSFFIR